MNTKLTLTLDKNIIEKGKAYANKQGKSLSKLFENYLKTITIGDDELNIDELSPSLKRLVGSVKLPANFDYKKAREEYLTEKYLSND